MGFFPDLPTILAWEICLALLVLGWSLLRLRTRRSARTPTVARAPSRRVRAAFVGLAFALAAASFTYAMPDLPVPEGRARTSSQRLRATADRAASGAGTRSGGDEAAGPERASSVPSPLSGDPRRGARDEAGVSGALNVAGRAPDPRRGAGAATPTPEATGSPTPDPAALPTVTPGAESPPSPTP